MCESSACLLIGNSHDAYQEPVANCGGNAPAACITFACRRKCDECMRPVDCGVRCRAAAETHLPSVRRKTPPPPLPSRRSIIYRIVCQRLDSVIAGLRMSYYAKWNGFQIMAACARLLMCVIAAAAAACYFAATAAWETFSCLHLCDFPQRWACWRRRANKTLSVFCRAGKILSATMRGGKCNFEPLVFPV